MRFLHLLTVSLLAACATTNDDKLATNGDLLVAIEQEAYNDHPSVAVTITNRSSHVICLQRELLLHPYSYAMDLNMRDARGRSIRVYDPGFIPPPLEGVVRVEPGGSEVGHYYLDSRFRLPNGGRSVPKGAAVRVSFHYGYCDEALSARAVTSWQPI